MADEVLVKFRADLSDFNKQLKATNQRLDKVEKGGKKAGKQTEMAFNKAETSANSLNASLKGLGAQLIAAFAIEQTIGTAVTKIVEFEKSVSNLSAITGATGADLEFLKNEAIAIGRATTLSSSQAVEAFKLIASAKPELLESSEALAEVTRQAVTLAEASGLELPEAATALTGALNQFSAPAEDAAKFINVLAAGSKFGSVAIPELTDSLTRFGTVAAKANISVEQSAALIETLGEKGIGAEKSGTGLRSILVKLQSGADQFNPAVVGLNTALDNLAEANLSVADQTKLFGLENTVAAGILIDNRDRVEDLTTALTGTSVAEEQAAINTDNLSGAFDRFGSALEAALLSAQSSGGIVTDVIDEISEGINRAAGAAEEGQDDFNVFATIFSIMKTSIEAATAPLRIFFEKVVKPLGAILRDTLGPALDAFARALGFSGEGAAELIAFLNPLNRIIIIGAEVLGFFISKLAQFTTQIADVVVPAAKALGEGITAIKDAAIDATNAVIDFANKGLALIGKQIPQITKDTKAQVDIFAAMTAAVKAQAKAERDLEKQREEARQKQLAALRKQREAEQKAAEASQKEAKKIGDAQKVSSIKFQEIQDKNTVSLEKSTQQRAKISEAALKDAVERDTAALNETEERRQRAIQQAIGNAQEFADLILEIQAQRLANELTAVQSTADKKQRAIDAQVERGVLTEKEAAKKKEEIAKALQEEERKIRIKQFKAEKNAAILQANINTALSVTRTFAEFGATPAGFILGALATALGLAQIAIIASQPVPEFAKGTDYLERGQNRAGVDTIPIMANEGEAIIPTDKNLQQKGLAAAWINGAIEDYVFNKWVAPALAAQAKEFETFKDRSFSDNVASSIKLTAGLNDRNLIESDKRTRAILQQINKNIARQGRALPNHWQ